MFKYVRLLSTVGIKILFDDVFYYSKYVRKPEKYPIEERWSRGQDDVKRLLKRLRCDLRIEGYEYIEELNNKNQRALFVGNHMSLIDPLILVGIKNEPMRMVGKKEIMKMPIVGKVLKSVDGLFMDREDLKQSLKIILECSKTLKDNDRDIVIFPEGTRNKEAMTTMPAPYHAGSFKAATRVGAPIIPFCIYGTFYELVTKPDFRSVPVELIFGKPIYKEEYEKYSTDELAEKVHAWTEEQVKRCRAFEKEYFNKNEQKIPFRKRKVKLFTRYDFNEMKPID